MRLRSQTTAALAALLDLSLHSAQHAPVPVSDIAKRQGVGVAFLEQLFRPLKKAGLVAPWRGIKGGYTLAKPAESLSLLEVMQALDDPAVRPYAVTKGKDSAEQKALAQFLGSAEDALSQALAGLTLAELKRQAQARSDLKTAPRRGAGFQI
jgi:Rrf2 family iron-sulfur cluster assembly transcriptional regulator